MSRKDSFLAKCKLLFSDSVWSILGLVAMNASIQFFLYPFLAREAGAQGYGNILYQYSFITIFSIAVGGAAGYARMEESAHRVTRNGDYHLPLLFYCAIFLILQLLLMGLGVLDLSGLERPAYYLLMCATAWRHYADVEFRLRLHYKGYFVYYLLIGAGYLLGIPLYRATRCWPLALLLGELAGILYVFLKGKILPREFLRRSALFRKNSGVIFSLILTNLLNSIVFYGDRLVLEPILGGAAVTIYYLASLIGKTISFVTTPFNNVILGHLARYRGKLTYRLMGLCTALAFGVTVLGTLACCLASRILIPILYPDSYADAAPYFVMASLAQCLHFVADSLAVVLLRFAKNSYQLEINVAYAVAFYALSIPGAYYGGLRGFTLAMLAACALRFAHCVFLGFYHVAKYEKPGNRKQEAEITEEEKSKTEITEEEKPKTKITEEEKPKTKITEEEKPEAR